jgi:hypothetical protein
MGLRVGSLVRAEIASSHETTVLLAMTGVGPSSIQSGAGLNVQAAGTSQLGAVGWLAMTEAGGFHLEAARAMGIWGSPQVIQQE